MTYWLIIQLLEQVTCIKKLFRLLTGVIGCTCCRFHLVVCVWMMKQLELLWVCVLALNFANPISTDAVLRSFQKALMALPADAVPAEQLVTIP